MKLEYDVIVIGSGPAGFSAAYYAAKNGADTLLVERGGTIGGMLTAGFMGVFCGQASSGLCTEMKDILCRSAVSTDRRRTVYDVEEMKQFLYAKADESGMSLLLYAPATGVAVCDGMIAHLEVHAKQGPLQLKAQVYVDATGDGDVAVFAGEDFTLGRESDGKFQPMSLMFGLDGVNTDDCAVLHGGKAELRAKLQEYVERGEVPYPAGHVIIIPGVRPGSVKINMTNVIDCDGTRSDELTRAEVECRRQLAAIVAFLRMEAHGFENCYVSNSAELIGVRSSRHIHGTYVLNEKDISDGRVFDDWVVSKAKYGWGTHNLYGPIHGRGQKESVQSTYGDLPTDKYYTIPYRSLQPLKTGNLLLAGRCISGTFLAHSNYRVMPICIAMGQAAGTAAALAVKENCTLAALDVQQLQAQLITDGVEPPE
jgi:hypothetical protein